MFPSLGDFFKSDILLLIVLLVFIGFVSLRIMLPLDFFRPAAFTVHDASLAKAAYSFSRYERASRYHLSRMHNSYTKGLRLSNQSHKRICTTLGYREKLDRLEKAIQVNGVVTRDIYRLAAEDYGGMLTRRVGDDDDDDLGRVREALKHLVRDWSDEGVRERDVVFSPIFDILTVLERDPSQRLNKKVLIPGSGLGRLAWEVSQLGFDTTANERSAYMNLAFRFLLSPNTTSLPNQHTIHPYAHWFSHQRSNDSLFRPVTFPDSIPRLTPTFHLSERDFFDIQPPKVSSEKKSHLFSSSSDGGYPYIITLFFIDTSLNIIKTIQQIFSLLEEEGVWINLGPLLWPSSGVALELSLEEVLQVASEVGFELLPLSRFIRDNNLEGKTSKTIQCEYTGDQNAMMRWTYEAELWVAKKPGTC